MTATIKTWKIDMKDGQPAVWEFGGARDQVGSARVIAGPDGRPCRPVEVASELLPCGKHALFPVEEGHLIIDGWWDVERADDDLIFVWRVLSTARISETEASVTAGLILQYADGDWVQKPCAFFESAILAVEKKAMMEACAEVCYADLAQEAPQQRAPQRSQKKRSPRNRTGVKKGVSIAVTSEVTPVPIPIVEGAPVVSSAPVEPPPVPVEAQSEPCAAAASIPVVEEIESELAPVATVVAARELASPESIALLAKHFGKR